MKEKPRYLFHRAELGTYFSQLGRRLRKAPATLRPLLVHQYSEMSAWLRMLNTRKKWKPVQAAYDKAYKAARGEGVKKKEAHLRAKCAVQNEFQWVHERNLGKDPRRGIIPYE